MNMTYVTVAYWGYGDFSKSANIYAGNDRDKALEAAKTFKFPDEDNKAATIQHWEDGMIALEEDVIG